MRALAQEREQSGFAMKRDQFRTGNTQIVGGIKDDGLIKLPGVEGDFREALKQQRVGDQA